MNYHGIRNKLAPLVRTSGIALSVAVGTLGFSSAAYAQVEIDFWDMIWGPPEYIDAAEATVEKFNEEHPDITVNYRSIPWSNWYQTFVSAVSAGSAPDVSTGAGYQAVQLYDMGAIRPIDDLIEEMRAEGSLEDFAPGAVDTLRYDDHYVALPWGIDIRVWWYRKSLLEEAGVEVPTTFAEMREAAAALTTGDQYGLVSSGDTGGTHYLFSAMLNNGGGLFDDDRNLTLKSERNMEAMNWLGNMVEDGSVHPASAGYSSDDRTSALFQGQAAFMLDGPGLRNEASEDVASDLGVMSPLEGPHGDKGTIYWVNNIMMYEQTEHPEASKTFLKWWSKNQLPLWTEGHTTQIPARQSFVEQALSDNEDYLKVVDEYLPVAKTTGYSAEGIFPELSEIEGEGVMQTLTQQLWQGRAVEDIMTQAQSRMQDIME